MSPKERAIIIDAPSRPLIRDPVPVDEDCNEIAIVMTVPDGPPDARAIYDRFRYGRQIVLVTERMDNIPSEVKLAADVIAEIPSPSADHYMAASRVAKVRGMTPEIASLLTGFSFDAIASTVRGTRPLLSAVRQLKKSIVEAEKSAPAPVKPKGPSLEELAGYGAAKTWGLQLAADLRAWKAGEIAWEDVDRGALLHGPPGCGRRHMPGRLRIPARSTSWSRLPPVGRRPVIWATT